MAEEKDLREHLSQLPLHNSSQQAHSPLLTRAHKVASHLFFFLRNILFSSILVIMVHYFASLFLAFPLSGILWLLRPDYIPPCIPRVWDWLLLLSSSSSQALAGGGVVRFLAHLSLHLLPAKKQPFADASLGDISMCLTFYLGLGMDLLCLAYWAVRWTRWKRGIRRLGIWKEGDDKTMPEEKFTTVRKLLKQIPGWKPITLYYVCAAELGGEYISRSSVLLAAWGKSRRETTSSTTPETETKMTAKTAITILTGFILACYLLTLVFLTLCFVARGGVYSLEQGHPI